MCKVTEEQVWGFKSQRSIWIPEGLLWFQERPSSQAFKGSWQKSWETKTSILQRNDSSCNDKTKVEALSRVCAYGKRNLSTSTESRL